MSTSNKFALAIILTLMLLGILMGINRLLKPDEIETLTYEKAIKAVSGYCKTQCGDEWLRLIEVSRSNTEFYCVCKKEFK